MRRFIILLGLLSATNAFSQVIPDSLDLQKLKQEIKKELREELKNESIKKRDSASRWNDLNISGYGVINYYNQDFDTDPNLKNKIDTERLNLYIKYQFSDKISFKSEIEFEHGGTGSTIELDTQEEFGEFEQEIEKGGKVSVEQLNLNFDIVPYFNIRAGRVKLYLGLSANLDSPAKYFTTQRSEMESAILPLGWYENGIEFHGTFAKRFMYKAYIVNGLDASGFSSRNWIKLGYQTRFEMSNAESFAFAGRLDYKFGNHKDTFIGLSAYINDAAANRPKSDMKESAYVTLVEGHISYNENNLRFNAMALYGNLENSNIVALKNANLSNKLGVKRTPVGKNALGISAEIGYNILPLLAENTSQKLYPFMRYDYYDTMHQVEGNVLDNPRWERSVITGGLNWFLHPQIVVKAHYSDRRLGSLNYDPNTLIYTGKHQHERTFSAGLGFKF